MKPCWIMKSIIYFLWLTWTPLTCLHIDSLQPPPSLIPHQSSQPLEHVLKWVYNPTNLTEAPAQKSGHALQWSAHCRPSLKIFVGWWKEMALLTSPHAQAGMVFRTKETECAGDWSLTTESADAKLYLRTHFTDICEKLSRLSWFEIFYWQSYWFPGGYLTHTPTLGVEHLNPPLWGIHQIQQNPSSPPDFMLLQEKDPSTFNCFPGSYRFNLT